MSEQLGAGLDIEGRTDLRASARENLSSELRTTKAPLSFIGKSHLINTSEISIFSVAEQAGLVMIFSENQKTGSVALTPNYYRY